ncbi:MAG: hypothetical protein KDD33_13260 [Bdellovibrionales bacterium]|nr:hypothetical protein [Bdellovibrionales bacterium]
MKFFILGIFILPLSLWAGNPDPNTQPPNASGFVATLFGIRTGAQGVRDKAISVSKAANGQAKQLMNLCKAGNEMACMISGIVTNVALRVASEALAANAFEAQVSLQAITPTQKILAQAEMQKAVDRLAELEGMGFVFAPDGTITLPSGEKIHVKDLKTESALLAAGFSAGEIPNLLEKLDKALAVIGGQLPQVVKSVAVFKDPLPQQETPSALAAGDTTGGGATLGNATPVEGLSVDFQGTPIGVSTADLFNIVSIVFQAVQANGDTLREEKSGGN